MLGIFVGVLFMVLVVSLVNLQIRSGDAYGLKAESRKTKAITSRGDRGMILDANSKILAYDKKIYDICFYRDPRWNPGKDAAGVQRSAYKLYSSAIAEAIEIVERYGGETVSTFFLKQDLNNADYAATNGWYFDWGDKDLDPDQMKARETLWRKNFFVVDKPIQDIFQHLVERYRIDDDKTLSMEEKTKILSIWQEMQMNAFLSTPITIAKNVSWETVIEIETRSMVLNGVSVAVNTQRVYPNGMHMAHVIGYIGKIQNINTYNDQLKDKGYRMDDLVGLDGVEKSMEEWLTPNSSLRQGRQIVEIDRYGAVSRVLENTPPKNGNNVKLTIDSSLQRVAENALEFTVNEIRSAQEKQKDNPRWLDAHKETLQGTDRDFNENPIKLAEKGALIVIDMKGRVKALASYPPYDPNAFIVGGEDALTILRDTRNPLINYVIASLATPGSIFKMVTASAGMASTDEKTGLPFLTPTETISDMGKFDKYDKTHAPRCWIDPKLIGNHANLNIEGGLRNSCNYFFYTVASRIGSERLYKYAALYGLTSKTGIDLPGELQSYVGNQKMLYDPSKAINPAEQATWRPTLVAASIKKHLVRIGRERNITFEDSKLDRAIKRLMDMAVAQQQSGWVRGIRTVLMEELDMSRELVYLQVVVGDIYIMLNEIKWGGNETIMAGIGQSITQVTPAAVSRYVAALANGGTVYDLTLIDSITTPDGDSIGQRDPITATELPELAPFLPYIQKGMQGVIDESGTAGRYFTDFEYAQNKQMAAKTGTAQVSKIDLENNAWMVAYAPFDNPEIAIVCYVPNGYGGAYCSPAIKEVIGYYMEHRGESTQELIPAANSLAY